MIRIAFAAAGLTLAAAPFAASAQQGPMRELARMGPFTLAQMQESTEAHFTAMDIDHDGVLSAVEASPPEAGGNRRGPGRGIERADADRDGNITLAEYHAMTAGVFARLDVNEDGTVTPEELQALRGTMGPGGMRGPGGPGAGMGVNPENGMPGEMQQPDGD